MDQGTSRGVFVAAWLGAAWLGAGGFDPGASRRINQFLPWATVATDDLTDREGVQPQVIHNP